jgi:hypothetical protein
VQIVWAYDARGGANVVVLCSRPKLAMERLFRSAIPNLRGSRFIFRQGNPLLPSDLDEVACAVAGSVIIVADNSRCDAEADAQTMRTCVLIDELLQLHIAALHRTRRAPVARAYRPPTIVAEVHSTSNVKALRFAVQQCASPSPTC